MKLQNAVSIHIPKRISLLILCALISLFEPALWAQTPPWPASLTPAAPQEPRINGPSLSGVRPGSPFIYTIPTTGLRPMTFSVEGLPKGLAVDPSTGHITGSISQAGEYPVTLVARNSLGQARRAFRIVVGSTFALTPPMGWNSYNVWDQNISQEVAIQSAKAMIAAGLDQHGWTYVNMDDGWQGERGGPNNALQPDTKKFSDIKSMVDQIHAMGLKVGIYHTPWITSYGGIHQLGRPGASSDNPDGKWVNDKKQHRVIGKYSFVKQDAQQFAEWGFDYLKYDWNPNQEPETKEMEDALLATNRDIFFSLSNSMRYDLVATIAPCAQSWRTSGDITDSWQSMTGIGFRQLGWIRFQSPGHFNDPDMLIVGQVGWGHPRPTRLTPDEQYSHISLWCLLSAPLLMGCDLTKLDPFTLGLLTNDEVLALDQDPLCQPARCLNPKSDLKVYEKDLEDGAKAIGLFNTSPGTATMSVAWADAGLSGKQQVRDLWRQQDLGEFTDKYSADVPSHGVLLLRVSVPKK